MKWIDRIFGRGRKPSRNVPRKTKRSKDAMLRDMVQLAFKETLHRHGIPEGWLELEVLHATQGAHAGIHARLVLRRWRPDLMPYAYALLATVEERLRRLNSSSPSWLMGTSLRFGLVDGSAFPALPAGSAHWTKPEPVQRPKAPLVPMDMAWLDRMLQSDVDPAKTLATFSKTQPLGRASLA